MLVIFLIIFKRKIESNTGVWLISITNKKKTLFFCWILYSINYFIILFAAQQKNVDIISHILVLQNHIKT